MQVQRVLPAVLLLVVTGPLAAQTGEPRLRLRSGPIPDNLLSAEPSKSRAIRAARTTLANPGRSHLILQFAESPGENIRRALESRQFSVLAYVPDDALLVSAPLEAPLDGLGLVYAGVLTSANKYSALLGRNSSDEVWSAVVEMHADVSESEGRQITVAEGLTIIENPDLPSHSLLVRGPGGQLEGLASRDEVARVYPASPELLGGRPTAACRGGAIPLGAELGAEPLAAAASLAASFGDGWDGPGLGSASLTYNVGRLTPALDPSLTRAELVRALTAWSSAVKISFAESSLAQQRRQIDFLFVDRAHGDGQDMDGRGGMLAHTYHPPPNAEPNAGDLHFDVEEQWRIGNDVDVFSVALHEIGHALGLGHSDDPDAVMYPYYRRVTMLHGPDVVEIRKLYAANAETAAPPAVPAPPPTAPAPTPTPAPGPSPDPNSDTTPPTLVITTPALSSIATRSASYSVRGRAGDNVRVTSVIWSSSNGLTGTPIGITTFNTGPIPLAMGQNRVSIAASDAAGNTAWRVVTITRR